MMPMHNCRATEEYQSNPLCLAQAIECGGALQPNLGEFLAIAYLEIQLGVTLYTLSRSVGAHHLGVLTQLLRYINE